LVSQLSLEMGPIGHSPNKANPVKQKKCNGESCTNQFSPSTVSDTLCQSCKAPPTGFTPVGGKKSVEKRGSDTLSPITQPEAKASKNDESREESEGILLNNHTSISGLNSQVISSYMAAAAKDTANNEQKDRELANLRAVNNQLVKELTQVKLALADSAVKIFNLEKAASETLNRPKGVNNGAPPSVTTARPEKKISYANVAKITKKPVFTLMAKVAQPGGSVSVKQVHSFIDFENDGPPVQSLRVENDKVSLKFRSQAELDLAKSRLVNNAEAKKLLDNIHAPSFLYPVLVKVADVNMGTYPFPSKNDTAEIRKKTIESVKVNLGLENPQLAGHIGSFRVLNTRVVGDSTTHLVHLGLTS